jgi:membrane-associated phospholipid phosphatase
VGTLVAEIVTHLLKRLVGGARPDVVFPDLDSAWIPPRSRRRRLPLAHTAVVVALTCAMWPWLRRSQKIVAVGFVTVVPLNRVYVGAHWPIDLIAGAAVGLLAAAVAWLDAVAGEEH